VDVLLLLVELAAETSLVSYRGKNDQVAVAGADLTYNLGSAAAGQKKGDCESRGGDLKEIRV
jgi:hypothetical protein